MKSSYVKGNMRRRYSRSFTWKIARLLATPMNAKESLSKDDGADNVEEGYFKSMIGCLMYLTTTRPYILFVVSILSQFMHCAIDIHLKTKKKGN